jgi:hypothetical protein
MIPAVTGASPHPTVHSTRWQADRQQRDDSHLKLPGDSSILRRHSGAATEVREFLTAERVDRFY